MEEKGPGIVIAGGGTGGHLFPALAVADELKRRRPDARIEFVGGRRGLESRLVPAAGYPLRVLPLSGLKGASLPARAMGVVAAGAGVLRCAVWMLRSRPHLVIGVGGYASGPAVLAGQVLGVKTMVLEQNHFPGATNRWLAPHVDAVCVPSDAARRRLGGLGIVTGNPVRPEFARIGPAAPGARLMLLVFGGSRGARSINRAMVEALPELARMTIPLRIVHQTGQEETEVVAAAYAGYPSLQAEVTAFIEDMPRQLAGADIVVCRAGATTLSELATAGRPALLVPYPHAADDHQRLNAEAVQEAGAALVVRDQDLDGRGLASIIAELAADPARRLAMGEAARRLAVPDAAARIVDVAERLIAGQREEEGGAHVP